MARTPHACLRTHTSSGTTSVTCTLGAAVDQNDGSTISGYKYYLCVVALPVTTRLLTK